MYKYTTEMRKQTERAFEMGEKRESKLQHIMKLSWDSEQMPGWEDTLSKIIEATTKEFRLNNKEVAPKGAEANTFENNSPTIEEDFSM